MPTPLLTTKLFAPPLRLNLVVREQLLERLSEGLRRKLTLVSAPAGFGKTTLVSAWVAACGRPAAWLSLDEGDNDPARFLAYLVAALQTVAPAIGAGVAAALQSPQPPPAEVLLTALLNEVAAAQHQLILVLDDYHLIESGAVDQALSFLVERLPPQLHLVIVTREDPPLPLARLRARDQLTELRVADLRFTRPEAAEFLNQAMSLDLSAEAIAALEARTEGWVTGLQLAALSLQRRADAASFIASFAGSHHFVLDYLMEEVLHQQPERLQTFLLRTSILERMCGPLCEAVVREPAGAGQATLEQLERANLFLIPLDSERRWYRYHHLFADVLRQRLHQRIAASPADLEGGVAELHRRASIWYEEQGLEFEAFHHAAAAHDIDRAARLLEGEGMPLLFRGAVAPALSWLESLPAAELDARPALWVLYGSALVFASQLAAVEPKLVAAEAAIGDAADDARARDLVGHIAAIRATLAVVQHRAEEIIAQSRRALAHLRPDNLPVRTATTWAMGYAHQLLGERAAARAAYSEAIAISQAIGHSIITLMATMGQGLLEEAENQLDLAAETFRRAVELAGDPPQPAVCEAQLGLARICYEWNDLEAAQRHGHQGLQLARQVETTDRVAACELFLARLRLALGDVAGAATLVARADRAVRRHGFSALLPEAVAAQVRLLLRQGELAAAERLARAHKLPRCLARVHLAQGDPAAALAALELARALAEARGWPDERLRVLVLQALAFQAQGERGRAIQLIGEALALAEPGGFVRLFLDEGAPMAELLAQLQAAGGGSAAYLQRLLVAFRAPAAGSLAIQPLVEPLSRRELLVLQLIAQGLSNQQISERLVLALSTVKGHTRNIFGKLQVERRTEAVARARELGLL